MHLQGRCLLDLYPSFMSSWRKWRAIASRIVLAGRRVWTLAGVAKAVGKPLVFGSGSRLWTSLSDRFGSEALVSSLTGLWSRTTASAFLAPGPEEQSMGSSERAFGGSRNRSPRAYFVRAKAGGAEHAYCVQLGVQQACRRSQA